MSIKLIVFLSIVLSLSGSTTNAQRLDKFASNGKVYKPVITYFGYINSETIPDETINGKTFYYLYFKIADTVPEIGVRIISPVPVVVMPDEGDLVAENYYDNEHDKNNYFDTWVAIERAMDVKPEHFSKPDSTIKWLQLGFNDDSQELFPQPNGKYYNSLLRIKTKPDDATKIFPPGLYRIRFSDNKNMQMKGGFVVQLGTTTKTFKLRLVKNPLELN